MTTYDVSCRHCARVIIEGTPSLHESDYTAMREHLKRGCSTLSLDVTAASVGELLKQYDVVRTPGP